MTPEAADILDAAFDILKAIPGYVTYRKDRALPDQDDAFPVLGAFFIREQMNADGDLDAGEPRFVNELTLGVSSIGEAKPGALEADARTRAADIMNALLKSASFNREIEGFSSVGSSIAFPGKGDRLLAEARVEFTVVFRTDWPPVIPDDYLGANVTARPSDHDTSPAISAHWDQEQNP
ncbi:hypothetical protein SAMN05216548_12619 [Faunimonas pinastri]|uniref:Uncharacterized protein n=1 Tax=Faunimonas pinastri TaxID=1855383 RepID=A0A1H9Q9R0_9HYPH|nr:hypothetical protein [Faunimonas pinastri]SER57167.1 hypothetical protein SAMN05216548_12619 [Faunimonas pinastri]